MPKATRFNATRYLNSEERRKAYIAAALETGDLDFIRDARAIVARARRMAKMHRAAGLNPN
jgi:probable addiction module antidote protein